MAEWIPGSLEHTILELVREHATPLARRLRGPLLEDLARRLIAVERPRPGFSEPQLLALHALRMQHVVRELEEELTLLERRFAAFSDRWFARTGDRERRELLVDYIVETVPDRLRRRADLKALGRFLDFDALRERHVLRRHRLLAAVEAGLDFIGHAGHAALTHRLAKTPELMAELFVSGKTDEFLRARGEKGPRWLVRHAAFDAMARVLNAVRASGSTEAFEAHNLGAALRAASNRDEHPWVQGAAVAVVLALSPRFAEPLLAARLLELPAPGDLPPRDFLVRRQIIDLMAAAGDDRALALVHRVLAARDPSEHVRLGLTAAVARSRAPRALRSLRISAGLDAAVEEPSPRVRAAAARAARESVLEALTHAPALTAERLTGAVEILVGLLARDEHSLPLRAACEASGLLALDLAALRRRAGQADAAGQASRLLAEMGPRLLAALVELSARAGRPARVHEAAAHAAEQVTRAMDPERDAWTAYLAAVAGEIPPGRERALDLARLPAGLPPLPEEPAWLGRILAELTHADWGLAAARRGAKLVLSRGDRFRRRMWRLVHELTHPAPGKRQAVLHTVGRAARGELRAPPGGLDEVTATVVPGERVVVDSEGDWARHLPAVDDLLDLTREVRIFSSHGVTTLAPPASRWARLLNRFRVSLRYRELHHARQSSLRGAEPHERQRYLAEVARDFGIQARFERYTYPGTTAATPSHVAALFGTAPPVGDPLDQPVERALALGGPLTIWHQARDWFDLHGYYFFSPIQNSQAALALFAGGFAALFFAEAFWKRQRIQRARARIPLTIGGWGTRGKSGTERLKAALFHGLGYEVFVKTTGCEAMIIHSVPDEPARELFIFRSYDKATIWEMRDTLELAAALGTEVYLWECMALTPTYVELLQRDWMRDDIVTITNAYPDHEDIQGPAGINIAECVTSFIPTGATCLTSEVNFLPLFADVARARGTRLLPVPELDAELIAEDLLALFPYKEHPRNIALAARLAEDLGIDRSFAIATMAEHVVPDIGVLKTYPPARVRGRVLSFVNGMSANERTGFINNWTRMGLDALDPGRDPERMVVTVVNNRADRVSRSEVFARILVEDAAADAHVLIGTNLSGLLSYIHHELDAHVADLEVLVADDLRAPGATQPFVRLGRHLARLRVPHPDWRQLERRLWIYAAGARLAPVAARLPALEEEVRRFFSAGPLSVAAVRDELGRDAGLLAALEAAVTEAAVTEAAAPPPAIPEVVAGAGREDFTRGFLAQLARIAVHARLRARLEDTLADAAPDVAGLQAAFRAAYRELFLDSLVVVPDPGARGDEIIDRCARVCPPGTTVTLMGIQNIKGTGLDFVYRWLALSHVTALCAEAQQGPPDQRMRALRALESFDDHGLVDSGMAAAALARTPVAGLSDADAGYLKKVTAKMARVHAERLAALGQSGGKDFLARSLDRVERWVDPLDSIRRRGHARQVMKDLVAHRISHARAAVEMRKLYERQKGGWLSSRRK